MTTRKKLFGTEKCAVCGSKKDLHIQTDGHSHVIGFICKDCKDQRDYRKTDQEAASDLMKYMRSVQDITDALIREGKAKEAAARKKK